MRIRVFRAPRTAEAMDLVRATLGEEAVILGTRRVGGEVEVTAALEAPDPILILPDAPAAVAPSPSAAATEGSEAEAGDLPAILARHNLPGPLARRLLAGRGGGALPRRLEAALRFAPLPDGREQPLLLAGPPGAGKTLTCAKLAARAVLAGQRPLVVTTDTVRAGAAEQLAAFTRLLGLPLALAAEPGTLAKAVAAHRRPGQPVLVDTGGCDPFQAEEARALLSLARAAAAEVVLVLPGGLDPAEAAELARGFALLGAAHLLPTRLDQARRLGSVLAAAAEAGLALTEAGVGPGATDALVPVTPDWLAERLQRGGGGAPRPPPTQPPTQPPRKPDGMEGGRAARPAMATPGRLVQPTAGLGAGSAPRPAAGSGVDGRREGEIWS
jgi:flagellar biosynthesis protein FlhF